MAGGEGSLSRRTPKILDAATGPQATTLRSCSTTKRKVTKEAPPTVPHDSSKRKAAKDPASRRMPLPRATTTTRRMAKEETAAAATTGAAGEHRYRLSKAYVSWILSLKPMEPPARVAALKRSNPELTPQPGEEADEDKCRRYRLARAFFEMEESLPRMQRWMRGELREKGYIELDGEMAKGRAEVDALIDREWPAIEAKIDALVLQDKEYRGGEESDSGEGEDSDECDEEEEDGLSSSDEGEGEDDKVKQRRCSGT